MFTAKLVKEILDHLTTPRAPDRDKLIGMIRESTFPPEEGLCEAIKNASAYWKMCYKVCTEDSEELLNTRDIVAVSDTISMDLAMFFGLIMATKTKKKKKTVKLKNLYGEEYLITITFGDD